MRDAVILSHPIDPDASVDEAALIHEACSDPAAFGPLYERYRDQVYWYLRTRTSSTDDAADLMQQVFLRALDRLPQYNRKKGLFVAWLFGIARNAANNQHRGRRTTVSWDLVPDVLRPISQDDPESCALRNESLARLVNIFVALEPDKRELLVLRYVVGLSFAEVGAIVGKSEAATRQQVSRLLRALKEQNLDNV
jgi:RNA polymerase sigma-70 factor (ECF subfamily)